MLAAIVSVLLAAHAQVGDVPPPIEVLPPGTPAPPPPPAPDPPGPPPEYAAECRLVSREGKISRLSAQVANKGTRVGYVSTAGPLLSAVRGSPRLTASSGTTDWRGGWTRTDSLMFEAGNRTVAVKITVQDRVNGAAIEVVDMHGVYGVPLHAGMCRTTFK